MRPDGSGWSGPRAGRRPWPGWASGPSPARASDERLAREEKRQARRRVLADEAAGRLEERARRAEADLEEARHESTELRRSNRSLANELERTEAQVVALTEERQLAVRQLKAAEATLVERAREAKRAREDAERLRRELAAAQQQAAVAEARAAGLPPPPRVGDDVSLGDEAGPAIGSSAAPRPGPRLEHGRRRLPGRGAAGRCPG